MNFKNNLLSFIYDKDFCICMYDNKVFIYKYKEIINFLETEFLIKVENKTYKIEGKNLKVKKLTKDELVIEGNIKHIKLEETYEKN